MLIFFAWKKNCRTTFYKNGLKPQIPLNVPIMSRFDDVESCPVPRAADHGHSVLNKRGAVWYHDSASADI